MLPTVQNEAELRAALADDALWPRVAPVLSARHGLSLQEQVHPGSSFPVLFDQQHVVKLVPHRWRAKFAAERIMLELVHGKLTVATPEIIAAGELGDWSYLVMTRLTGRPASAVFELASDTQRRTILRAVGELIARVHALPAPQALAPDWPRFVDELVAGCTARHARGGASPAWISAIPARLAEVVSDLASPARLVPMHADVHTEHILLDDALQVTGLLDFGDAFVGDPAYDLVTPVTFFVRGRADLLAALFEGYGAASVSELHRRGTAYQLLHRFSNLKRDVHLMAVPREPATLDATLDAIWPLG